MRVADPDRPRDTRSRTRTLTARLASLKPTSHDFIDAFFVGVLLMIAFTGFITTFDSVRILAVAAVGILVGLMNGHAAVIWRWPWPVLVFACLFWYFLLGTPAAFSSVGVGGFLPSLSSVTMLAYLPLNGWKGMLTTLPPLDASGPYAALILLLALVSSALSYLISRRAPRPAIAILLPVLTFAGVILLGTFETYHPRIQGAAFAMLGLGWLANRFPRRRRLLAGHKPRRSTLVLGAGMVVAGLAGGISLGPHLPGTENSRRLIARTFVQPPIDMSQYVSPLVGFRKYSSKELGRYHDEPMLEISGVPAGTWLRFSVLDSYNGHVWSATGEVTDPDTGFLRLGSRLPHPPGKGILNAKVTILEPYATNTDLNAWVPGYGRHAGLGFAGLNAKSHYDALRFNLSTEQAVVADRLKAQDTVIIAAAPLRTFDALGSETRPGPARRVNDSASLFLGEVVQAFGGDESAPLARLKVAAEKLRSGAWSDGSREGERHFLPGHGEFRLSAFASSGQLVGSDEQFAAVFALLANRYGFPARVVLGALTPSDGPIKGKDVKAWVEIQIEGGEWVTVPTDVFTPDRSKQPSESQKPADNQSSSTNVPPPNPARPPGSYGDMLDTEPASNRINRKTPEPESPYLWLVLWIGAPVSGILLVVGLIVAAKLIRSRRRRTRGELWTRIASGWRDLLDQARDAGRRIPYQATRLEQSALLGEHTLMLAEDANAAVFSGERVTEPEVAEYWAQVRQARAQFAASLPWWRRPLARISLRSFLPPTNQGKTSVE